MKSRLNLMLSMLVFGIFSVSILSPILNESFAQEVEELPTWSPFGGNKAYEALPLEEQAKIKQLWYLQHPDSQRPDETIEDLERRQEQSRMESNLDENIAAIKFVLSKLSEEQLTSTMGELLPDQLEEARKRVADYMEEIEKIDADPLKAAEEYTKSHGRKLDPTESEIRRNAGFARKHLEKSLRNELNEVVFFHQMRIVDSWRPDRRGITSTLVDTPLGEALGLSKRQKEKLRQRSDEIGIGFMRAYKNALRETDELYAEILNDEQSDQLKEIYYLSSELDRPFVPRSPRELLDQISQEALSREADRMGDSGKH